ncbi:MFS transporter [Nocardia sp. IFM 10818]
MTHRATISSTGIGAAPVLLIVCAASFLTFLDVSVVNIAFPSISGSFTGTPESVLTWVVSGYTVTFAAGLAPAGRLADVIGRGRLFRPAPFPADWRHWPR